MEVRVHGRHVHVDQALRMAAETKVDHAARFWDSAFSADVEFTEEHNPRIASERSLCEITAATSGHTVRVHAAAETAGAALDTAVDKLERRLRELKKRLISRSRRPHKDLNADRYAVEDDEEPDEPPIVRVKQFVMKPMTPEEAVLQMDMLDHSFFYFHNSETDLPSVLYRRRRGDLGLIEPA